MSHYQDVSMIIGTLPKPNDLSLIPQTHMVEGRELTPKSCPLTSTHILKIKMSIYNPHHYW